MYTARFILNFMFYIFTLQQDIDSSGFFKLMHKKEQCHEIYQTDTGNWYLKITAKKIKIKNKYKSK